MYHEQVLVANPNERDRDMTSNASWHFLATSSSLKRSVSQTPVERRVMRQYAKTMTEREPQLQAA